MPQPDPFAGALAGIQHMASSINYLTMGGVFYLMHLNPQARELNVLVPVPGLERGGNDNDGTLLAGLRLAPVLTPLKADDVVTSRRGTRPTRWLMFKSTLVMWLRERGGMPLILRSAEESE